MIEWRRVVLSFPCPTCNAAPGEECTTVTGHPKFECHAERTDAAHRNRWREADS